MSTPCFTVDLVTEDLGRAQHSQWYTDRYPGRGFRQQPGSIDVDRVRRLRRDCRSGRGCRHQWLSVRNRTGGIAVANLCEHPAVCVKLVASELRLVHTV
jgi:hypothetical protein